MAIIVERAPTVKSVTTGGCQTTEVEGTATQTELMTSKDAAKIIASNFFNTVKSFVKEFLPPATFAGVVGTLASVHAGTKDQNKLMQVAAACFAGTFGLHIAYKLAMRAIVRH